MELKNKVAIVTGWTKWIWEAISLELAKAGVIVCVTYLSDDKNAQRFEEEIKKISMKYLVIKSDISNINDVDKLFQKVNNIFWRVEILVNNAWIFLGKEKESNLEKRYKKVFETNFFSCVYTTEKFREYFNWDLWKIINISSIAWVNPFSYSWWIRSPEYCCSKASMDLYTKIMAKTFEWKILVNWIAPWSTDTPIWTWADKDFIDIRAKESMIKRFMRPEEIAKTALFLLQNDAINWDIIVVDWWNILN